MEFIENAEGFYNGITFLKRALLDARVKKDEKKEKEIISEMESYLFHLKQFLGTIMERKDNIVDLGEVWHEISEPFRKSDMIIYGNNSMQYLHFADEGECLNDERNRNYKYAYVDDLLSKGGE